MRLSRTVEPPSGLSLGLAPSSRRTDTTSPLVWAPESRSNSVGSSRAGSSRKRFRTWALRDQHASRIAVVWKSGSSILKNRRETVARDRSHHEVTDNLAVLWRGVAILKRTAYSQPPWSVCHRP
jgi:hypothetical protein